MRIRERCACGAWLEVYTSDAASLRMRQEDEAKMWREVDRWRRLHKVCRTAMPEAAAKVMDAGVSALTEEDHSDGHE